MATDWPEAREAALAAILPAGTDRWVALFLGNPIAGGAELTLTGYARVAHQDWSTVVPTPGESFRRNASPITFPTITQAGTADYWAIYDAAVGGVLLRSGPCLDNIGQPIALIFSGLGDEARFNTDSLQIGMREV